MKMSHTTEKHLLSMYARCDKCKFYFAVDIVKPEAQLHDHVQRHIENFRHSVTVTRVENISIHYLDDTPIKAKQKEN